MPNRTVTYEPDNFLTQGYIGVFKELLREINQNRWLTFQLFRRDFLSMYKQSFVGVIWIFVLPIVNVAVFLTLSRSGVLNVGELDIPYPLYAILGMSIWQIFSTGTVACASSISDAGDMIKRINFSRKSLVFAAMGKPLVSFLVQLSLVALLFMIYGQVPNKGVLLLPLIVVPLTFLTLGVGFMLAILNAVVRDIGNLLPILMMFILYLTPVLYARPETGILSEMTKYNLVYYYVATARDLSLTGRITEPGGFAVAVASSLAIFTLSLVAFHLTETRIAERV